MNKSTVAQKVETSNLLPSAQGILQRKCACGNQTVGGGECAECGKKKLGLQRKLTIGASNDPLEREADRVADQVMAAPVRSAVSDVPLRIQRYAGQANESVGTAPASVDRVLASSGRPLESALRQDMGQRFGYDFSQVRVHSGAAAEQSARAVNSRAYTVGRDIVFGNGEYAPNSASGQRLLAHELTHVIQQNKESTAISQLQRWSYGSGAVPHGDYIEAPENERARVDRSMRILERISDSRANFPRCHHFFRDNCPGGTINTLKNDYDRAVIWKDTDATILGSQVNPANIAYTDMSYGIGHWAIAASMIHELIHVCGQANHDIGDQAKGECGNLPNI